MALCNRLSFLTRRRLIGAGAALGIGAAWGEDARRTLVIAIPSDPAGLDPALNRGEPVGSEIIMNMFDGLVAWRPGPGNQLEPRLASGWSSDASGRVYRFTLRPGVRFQDGALCDAAAVKFSIERTRALNPFMRPSLEMIEAIETPAPDQVEFRLARPVPFFPALLAQPQAAIVSPASVARRRAVGSGAFSLRRYEADTLVILDAFPGHFRGAARLERLVYRVLPDASTRRLELETGGIDISQQSAQLSALVMEDLKDFRRNPAIQIIETPSQIMRQLEFNNLRQDTPLHDVRVRQALAYAVDYDGLIDGVLAGTVDRAYGPLPTSNFAFDPGLPALAFRYDPERARGLLREAGVAPGQLGFTLYGFQGSLWATVATFLQANFAAIGVRARIEQLEFPSFRALQTAGQFEMALDGRQPWYNDPDAHITIGYLSDLATTAMTFRMPPDAGLDGAIRAAQSDMDPAHRIGLYRDIQRELLKRVPAVYLFTNRLIVFARAEVQNLALSATPPLTEYWGVSKR